MGRMFREIVPWPDAPVGEGLSRSDVAAISLALVFSTSPAAEEFQFRELSTAGLRELGVVLEYLVQDPRIHRVVPLQGDVDAVESESNKPEDADIFSGVAGVDTKHGWALVRVPAGTIRLGASPEGVDVCVELADKSAIGPLRLSRPALEAWCAPLGDAWLAGAVADRTRATDEPWELVCAAGMVATLAELSNTVRARSAAEALATRKVLLDAVEDARAWARRWSDEEFETVRDLALVTVEQLDFRLRDLAETVNPERSQSSIWIADFIRFCHIRDDLSSVLALTARNREDRLVVEAVTSLDRRAEPFVQLLDLDHPVDDERLRRVWLGQPDAWWGWPAAPDDEDETRNTSTE